MAADGWTLIGKFREAPRPLDNRPHMVLCSNCKTIQKLDAKCGICGDRVVPYRKGRK